MTSTSFIYSIFTRKSKGDDEEQQFPQQHPSPQSQIIFNFSDHKDIRDFYHYSSSSLTPIPHDVDPHSASSTSTRSQPSYQRLRVEPCSAQATANIKESPEPSHHVHRHGLAPSTWFVHTSASQALIHYPYKSTASRTSQTTSTESDHLDALPHTNLTSSNAWDSSLTGSLDSCQI